jgi:hypothetical protein
LELFFLSEKKKKQKVTPTQARKRNFPGFQGSVCACSSMKKKQISLTLKKRQDCIETKVSKKIEKQ